MRFERDSDAGRRQWRAPVLSQAVRQRDPLSQAPLHFIWTGLGILMADSVARDFARKLVQIKCQLQSLFASHRTVFFYLCVECCLRCHRKILARIELERAILCVDANGLAFADSAFDNVDAERVENFFLYG